jgi:transcription termination factor Rho
MLGGALTPSAIERRQTVLGASTLEVLKVNVGSHRSRRRRRRRRGPGQPGAPTGAAAPQPQQQQQQPRGPAQALGLPPPPPPVPPAQGKTYEDLTSIDPQPRISLEYPGCSVSCRLVDLFCPIGRGQRGLIVSPPKAGKTTLLKDIGTAILRNHPDLQLILLLVDERPEEVTDFRRHFAQVAADLAPPPMAALGELNGHPAPEPVPSGGFTTGINAAAAARCHVVASSNDNDTERHIAISTQTMEYCKQMVMGGRHIVILLDSLTRVGRAFNRSRKHSSSGRTLSGGIDSRALEVPKQIFGAARNTEEAGSLTIIATCLVDTGSQGDQVIFEEFKGTGNMELILDRKISERRLFPAINLAASGTRKEHLLMSEQEVKTITALRRRLMNMPPHQQVEQLLAAMQRFPSNSSLVGSPA